MVTKKRNSSSILFHDGLEALDRKFRIIYKKQGEGRGGERGQGARGPCESMWKNDQCWRRLNSQSLKSLLLWLQPKKVNERGALTTPAASTWAYHLITGQILTAKKMYTPARKSRKPEWESHQARHCWYWMKIKVIANKEPGRKVAEPRTMTE